MSKPVSAFHKAVVMIAVMQLTTALSELYDIDLDDKDTDNPFLDGLGTWPDELFDAKTYEEVRMILEKGLLKIIACIQDLKKEVASGE